MGYVFKRLCGFGGDNTYAGRYLFSTSKSYANEQCYDLVESNVSGTGTRWLPVDYSPKRTGGASGAVATSMLAPPQDNKIAGIDTLKETTQGIFDGISGGASVSFGAKKTQDLIPFVIAGAIAIGLLIWGGIIKIR